MGDIFNTDFQDFIQCLNKHKVDYILVGGYAVIIYGYRRPTGDLDIWVRCSEENYEKLSDAFLEFGMPLFDMSKKRFISGTDADVFTFGRPPVSIDIITKLKGVEFDKAFSAAQLITVEEVQVRVIHKNQLIEAKTASGRYRDLDDIEKLRMTE